MKAARYATSRQKACSCCSTAKAKCDRKAGKCTRCALRDLPCIYPRALPSRDSANGASVNNDAGFSSHLSTSNVLSAPGRPLASLERTLPARANIRSSIIGPTRSIMDANPPSTSYGGQVSQNSRLRISHTSGGTEAPDFSGSESFSALELFCPIDADAISNRWLNSYIPAAGQKDKNYPASIVALVYSMLKSYTAVAVHGRGVPPFVHTLQTTANSIKPPLSTCLTIVRMCKNPLPGSETVAVNVLQREMSSLHGSLGSYDDISLLAAFQAYLIYSMVLFFNLDQKASPFLRQAMVILQELACTSSRHGLMCTAEQQRARPRWETWIVAEAKRRTLFTMYLFDSLLSAQDGLPTLLGTELQGLPAPANRFLWRVHIRQEWEMAYNIHLTDWVEGLRIDELWPIPTDMEEVGLRERRSRVDQWLEGVDEFGTMLYAVTSCTHGR